MHVDTFDYLSRYYPIHRKTVKWTVRLFELLIGYALVNARTAYCVNNGYDLTKYTMVKFYNDLIRERYKTVKIVRSVETVPKGNLNARKICNWKDCTNRTTIPCANHRCDKTACDKIHSCLVCVECAKKPFHTLSIISERKKCNPVACKVFKHCNLRTTIKCSVFGCDKPVCILHRNKLCTDCCFTICNSSQSNWSVKIPALKCPHNINS